MGLTLADKYRPQRFDDIWGQATSVKLLSRLAQLRRGKPLLLSGAYGSGKTSLVRLFAKALNCERPDKDGSPCHECRFCLGQEHSYLVEYDVPASGGEKDKVRAWVDAHHREVRDGWRILFLDEAHALTPAAMTSLLKDVEDSKRGIAFAFATTDPWQLTAALRSRLLDIEVRPLDVADAVDFLESIARREGISYDREGLILLASVKQGHVRDLLGGLEHVAGSFGHVSAENVKSIFSVHHLELLVEYFQALAAGDPEGQISAMRRWHDPISAKVQGVQALLTSIFYNEILGQKVLIDAFVDSLTSERVGIVSRFCTRLNVDSPRKLERFWEKMLRFWAGRQSKDETSLGLCLSLFENLVNRGLTPEVGLMATIVPFAESPPAPQETWGPNIAAGLVFEPLTEVDDKCDQYLSRADVREIINRASFFIQHHDRMMNAAFTVYPSWRARSSERTAIEAIRQFREKLDCLCSDAGEAHASMTVYERDLDGIFGHVVAHVPQLIRKPKYAAVLADWCNGFDEDDSGGLLVNCDQNPGPNDPRSLTFHWDRVLALCASLDDDEVFRSPYSLLDYLRIPRKIRRQSGPIRSPVLELSGALTTEAIEKSCVNNMTPLSAFDALEWSWIRRGWERKEYVDRQEEIKRRQDELARVQRIWAADRGRQVAEAENLTKGWPSDPQNRNRSWRGWWVA
ncbi:AAA family ATPase [Bradyrhizobium quebecense]|uniref:AAA family ATPase n=1 Tax=Bradyrhizobium quebecense TaxID=2748629 RepID=A0A973WYP5_9BRAD|nr:AAA family ATPase [Bradyrhizobium quebecense]UGA43016.1 AAA family ATPase [Bradyrhizobium quebecense]